MTQKSVWQFYQAKLDIYLEDQNGNLMNVTKNSDGTITIAGGVAVDILHTDPAMHACYAEDITVTAELERERRPVTGRQYKKLTAREYEPSASISEFYFSKIDEFNKPQVFNRSQRLRIILTVSDPPDVPQAAAVRYETHTLFQALMTSMSLAGKDNDSFIYTIGFEAEYFE